MYKNNGFCKKLITCSCCELQHYYNQTPKLCLNLLKIFFCVQLFYNTKSGKNLLQKCVPVQVQALIESSFQVQCQLCFSHLLLTSIVTAFQSFSSHLIAARFGLRANCIIRFAGNYLHLSTIHTKTVGSVTSLQSAIKKTLPPLLAYKIY